MARQDQYVVAEYANYQKAEVGLKVLDLRGFGEDRVSLIVKHDSSIVELEQKRRAKREQPSQLSSGTAGAALAAGAAAPIALGTMIAPFFLIGPIAAAVAGAAAGSLFGPNNQLGLDEQSLKGYHQRVADGSILVVVHATGDDLIEAHGGLKTTDTLSLETF